jgi:hypothetical protein
VFNTSLGAGISSFTVTGLASDTAFTISLSTNALSDAYSATKTTQATTLIAPLSGITLLSLTSTSISFEFAASTGASSYTYLAANQG